MRPARIWLVSRSAPHAEGLSSGWPPLPASRSAPVRSEGRAASSSGLAGPPDGDGEDGEAQEQANAQRGESDTGGGRHRRAGIDLDQEEETDRRAFGTTDATWENRHATEQHAEG